ncbi:hypothetical protein AYI69_g2226 [Smittium culicis]|uniref:Uncharacterized protein n=1 Tax=Smittium culicis TaxID=133412 RepID=A0A1R1YN15_9FUNG|nr:hypothetical protein AYI69_g2226 [Smittium culicis]
MTQPRPPQSATTAHKQVFWREDAAGKVGLNRPQGRNPGRWPPCDVYIGIEQTNGHKVGCGGEPRVEIEADPQTTVFGAATVDTPPAMTQEEDESCRSCRPDRGSRFTALK